MTKQKKMNGGRRYNDIAHSEFGNVQLWTRSMKLSICLPLGVEDWEREMRHQYHVLIKRLKEIDFESDKYCCPF